jgi:hypothetical protein
MAILTRGAGQLAIGPHVGAPPVQSIAIAPVEIGALSPIRNRSVPEPSADPGPAKIGPGDEG